MEQKLLDQVKNFCVKNKERLTKPRIDVLKIISRSHKPISAYGILAKLSQFILQPKPQTVYRALDFWLRTRFIHRVKSLNAYILCRESHGHKGFQFTICEICGKTTETLIGDIPKILKKNFLDSGNFSVDSWTLEMSGLCKLCESKKGHN